MSAILEKKAFRPLTVTEYFALSPDERKKYLLRIRDAAVRRIEDARRRKEKARKVLARFK